jgi:cyclic pyranopterin phosphate synthase
MKHTLDSFNRPLQDLRISVIDRCNFRCSYCMPEHESQNYTFLRKEEWLEFDEILRLTKLFVELGVRKVRLTGGEPLLRPNLSHLVKQLSLIEPLEDLALTTNGALLKNFAKDLKEAGLKRLTVSLDALDEKILDTMSGKKANLSEILSGIEMARIVGFESIKINVVIQKKINDQSILDLVQHFKNSTHILRFIEYMDVGNCNHWDMQHVVPTSEIVDMINQKYPLKKIQANYSGEVAERYQFADGTGEIGFISSVTKPFCGDCGRARLSTDGKMYTCLFANQGTDLQNPLRNGASDETILEMIQDVWKKREDRYSEQRSDFLKSHKLSEHKKIEMFQIGG